MASKSNFFSKFLAFFLVLIIISGVSFLGYNLLSGSQGGMDMSSSSKSTDTTSSDQSKNETAKSTDTSSQEQMNMNDSSSNENKNTGDTTSAANSQYSTPVISAVLQNKDSLEKTLVTLKDSLSLMSLDLYRNEINQENGSNANGSQEQGNNGQNETTDAQGNTVVNVYPQNGTSQTTTMPSMGTTYDATKMEKLHTGQYKVAVGMQLLGQLKDNLSVQLEQASTKVTNPSEYYYTQYLTTVQNKNKLTEALTYINEASSLVNINPYVSQTGLVYDNQKMSQVHGSINKLAEAVVNLNHISDNFSKQTIELSNLSQNSQSISAMDMSNTGSSILSNISMTSIINGLVIVFIVILIVSIIGFIGRLLKSPKNLV